jgi:hypothetical protein
VGHAARIAEESGSNGNDIAQDGGDDRAGRVFVVCASAFDRPLRVFEAAAAPEQRVGFKNSVRPPDSADLQRDRVNAPYDPTRLRGLTHEYGLAA